LQEIAKLDTISQKVMICKHTDTYFERHEMEQTGLCHVKQHDQMNFQASLLCPHLKSVTLNKTA